jgi:hypothetical protein
MPSDPRKRQKKQERRTAKRKAKQHQLTKEKHAGLPERLAFAARYPVLHCWASQHLWSQGLGWITLSRQLPNGTVAFAVFLVDRYCLGVKNVMMDIKGRFTYDSQVEREWRSKTPTKDMSPATARKFVEGAVAYARALGLHPHPEYQTAKLIFGDIDASQSTEELEMGKDGKPFFVAGPHDTPERCAQILRSLEEHRGPAGFHYMMPMMEGMDLDSLPEDGEPEDEFDEEDEEGVP